MQSRYVTIGAVSGFLAVGAGAFGAHVLEGYVTQDLLEAFEVGARYHLAHSLAMVLVGSLAPRISAMVSGRLFLSGTLVFSGSLYILAISGVRAWGAVTPLGGVLLLLGWAALAKAGWSAPGLRGGQESEGRT